MIAAEAFLEMDSSSLPSTSHPITAEISVPLKDEDSVPLKDDDPIVVQALGQWKPAFPVEATPPLQRLDPEHSNCMLPADYKVTKGTYIVVSVRKSKCSNIPV